jgi:hypothetical protein
MVEFQNFLLELGHKSSLVDFCQVREKSAHH